MKQLKPFAPSVRQELKLGKKQASTLFPGSTWLWNTPQGVYVSIGFCFDHTSIIFISTMRDTFLYSLHPGRFLKLLYVC